MEIIVTLVILGLVWWLINMLPLPAPIPTIISVILIAIMYCLDFLGVANFPLPIHKHAIVIN